MQSAGTLPKRSPLRKYDNSPAGYWQLFHLIHLLSHAMSWRFSEGSGDPESKILNGSQLRTFYIAAIVSFLIPRDKRTDGFFFLFFSRDWGERRDFQVTSPLVLAAFFQVPHPACERCSRQAGSTSPRSRAEVEPPPPTRGQRVDP